MSVSMTRPPNPGSRMRLNAPVAFALTFLFGLAHAQAPVPNDAATPAVAAAPVAGIPVPQEAIMPVAGGPARQGRWTLEQLGVDYEITLRGIQGTAGVPFSVRKDQVVDRARLHLKYNPAEWIHLRGSLGKGFRTANVLAENNYLLASSRRIEIADQLDQEEAWNAGINATLYIPAGGREITLTGGMAPHPLPEPGSRRCGQRPPCHPIL